MRIVMLGMVGPLAGPALSALLEAGVELGAVAVPAPPGAPAVARAPAVAQPAGQIVLGPPRPPSLLQIAAAHGLPALALRRMASPLVREALAALSPDLGVVACWPWRLPPALLAVPRLGWLNLHPSPLPELRGPEPLFWALQEGRERTAVTLHWMDEGLDTGDIALQVPLELPEGMGWDAAESAAAGLGAALVAEAVGLIAAGERPRRAQGPGGSSRPAPGAGDFAIDPLWPAARAFRFMRGTAAWGEPYSLSVGGFTLLLGEALGYEPDAALPAPYLVEGAEARVRMAPGVLAARLVALERR